MADLYYSGSPDHSRYVRRADRLSKKRQEAALFVTAAVGLSFGINLLSSFLYANAPQYLAIPLTVVGLFLIIGFSYLLMWTDMDLGEHAPILLISQRLHATSPQLGRIYALVSGTGFGVTQEASAILLTQHSATTQRDIDQLELLVAETLLWWTICFGFRDGWYFPDIADDNLNISWVGGRTPSVGTAVLDLRTAINTHDHVFFNLKNCRTEFQAPEDTKLAIWNNEGLRTSCLELKNNFATVRCCMEWRGTGFPAFSRNSAWVPLGDGKNQVVYRLTVKTSYSWRTKIPLYRKAQEHVCWAERMADFLLSEVSFRSFERDREHSWRKKEVELVEKLLRTSRWQ